MACKRSGVRVPVSPPNFDSMNIFIITLITLVLIFLLNPVSKKASRHVSYERFLKVHIHHSVFGIILFIIGAVIGNAFILSVGLGMYLAHGVEEVYFNKKYSPKAFFVFFTRAKLPGRRRTRTM